MSLTGKDHYHILQTAEQVLSEGDAFPSGKGGSELEL